MFLGRKPFLRVHESDAAPRPAGEPAGAEQAVQLPLVPDRERRWFSEEEKVQVWLKGIAASGLNIAFWRFDQDGNLMCWSDYGDAESPHGWEIDHVVALGHGGTNDIANLRPIHCSRNRSLSFIFEQTEDPLGDDDETGSPAR